jgi:SAM-dependent methyltransferase
MTQDAATERFSTGYATWWAPVLAPTALGLLDRVAAAADGAAVRVLDVGTGTGTLARAALERWPTIRLDAIDAAEEMVAATRSSIAALPDAASRASVVTAVADRLPFEDGTFDVAVSSFVLQLVPNRHRALREIRRTLRPGGMFGFVTWVWDDRAWAPDDVLDDVLDDLGIGARGDDRDARDDRAGDLRAPEAAATELRRAGFRDVTWEAARLHHRFDPVGYVGFISEFDEQDLVASLEPDLRTRFRDELRSRLEELERRDPTALVLDTPVAYATGVRSDR